MSNPSPAPSAPPPIHSARAPGSGRRMWLWIAPAFVVGLVLFALAIRGSHGDAFFHAGTVAPAASPDAYPTLPAPTADTEGSGIGRVAPPVVDPSQAPPAIEPAIVAPPAPPATRPVDPPRQRFASDTKPRPIPGQTPPPDYPQRALMDGQGGTALVIVHIGPDGVPTATEIAQSSGSRELDRAASQAVRRWRFEPAMADGHPVVGSVVIPIEFKPDE